MRTLCSSDSSNSANPSVPLVDVVKGKSNTASRAVSKAVDVGPHDTWPQIDRNVFIHVRKKELIVSSSPPLSPPAATAQHRSHDSSTTAAYTFCGHHESTVICRLFIAAKAWSHVSLHRPSSSSDSADVAVVRPSAAQSHIAYPISKISRIIKTISPQSESEPNTDRRALSTRLFRLHISRNRMASSSEHSGWSPWVMAYRKKS